MKALSLALGWLMLVSCTPCPPPFEPKVSYTPPQSLINQLPSPFKPLSLEELQTLWGKELYLGLRFSEEGDGYRAITAFKSSLYLLPKRERQRREQLEYSIILSYYLAGKYKEALESYENSSLFTPSEDFPAKRELGLLLYESYQATYQCEKAEALKIQLEGEELPLYEAIKTGDLAALQTYPEKVAVNQLLTDYTFQMKSPAQAQALQALLPGAGYWYVGLKKAAITSFVINALFIAATAELAHRGYWAPALITFSLETGWYFGGINGAALAASEYNERLYEPLAKETLIRERLFPILRFDYAF